ncbi:hypothetical protein [Streptomyces lonarensis]|uniref:Uncharacterized protein n=1 Tax=Streptomyces lonarensis TaxID=700599 RepID=A0A7X6CXX8_9ACTN|nr:hypothetical protein [Streptomyces lonarensis]NJQ04641.1 hypothetical protein [Streptomyces lonarensis]
MFGKKKKQDEGPLTATLDWRDIRRFSAAPYAGSTAISPDMRQRCAGLTPIWAILPKGYLQKWGLVGFVDQPVEGDKVDGAFGLFTDPEHLRPICRLLEPDAGKDGSLVYTATDDQGRTIGTLTKVPPSHRLFKHTWRIDTPAGQVIHGRNSRATKQAHHLAAREILNPLNQLFGALEEGTGTDGGPRGRRLFWIDPADNSKRAHKTFVMQSCSADFASVTDQGPATLDRRLALLAVIAEGRSLHLGSS